MFNRWGRLTLTRSVSCFEKEKKIKKNRLVEEVEGHAPTLKEESIFKGEGTKCPREKAI